MTDRAKTILKELKKNDLAKKNTNANSVAEEEIEEIAEQPAVRSEVEEILAETDVNSITPLDALKLLYELKNKVNG